VRPFALGDVPADDVLRSAASAAQDARREDGSVPLYSSSSDVAHRRQHRLLRAYGAALAAGNQLRLVYQPRLDPETGRCTSVEALLRWRHPMLGEVSPSEFIPIIERTSLARRATQWVQDTALDDLAPWQNAGFRFGVSVNLSATNFRKRMSSSAFSRAC
jgi:EAL domain-containing protein (putative c-di-GMP-specific phosphodiesterase class I)